MELASVNQLTLSADKAFETKLKVDEFNATLNKGKVDIEQKQKQEFLELLVTQLQNQNPMEPMEDKEFIGQMAQLSSVEKLGSIEKGLSKLVSFGQQSHMYEMIGKEVSYTDSLGQKQSGVVSAIELANGLSHLKVKDDAIGFDQIMEIKNPKEDNPVLDIGENIKNR